VRKRRLLLGLMAAGTLVPRTVLAQAARLPLVSVLFIGEPEEDERTAKPFFEAMARSGWIEGKTINYQRHSGKGTRPHLETMASNVAGSEPDLVFATTASLAAAALKENARTPMVFITMADPVKGGLVESLKKPGRNATGSYQVPGDAAAGKRFAYVKQAVPELKRMGAVFDRNAVDYAQRRASHEKAARAHGIELLSREFTNFEAIAKIFAQLKREGIHVCEVTQSFALTGRRREGAQLAERNGIALVAHRRAASLAHRILKGEKPGELPVETPNRLELVVNPKAALAFGIAIPKTLLQKASRVVA
jgi:putative ABC transport system substrate-binding protein